METMLLEMTDAAAARAEERAAPDLFTKTGERIAVANVLLEAAGLFTDCLALVAPDVHRRTVRITGLVSAMAERLGLEERWEFEVAARLSQIGCLSLAPDERAAAAGTGPSEDTERAFASHPLVGRDLLTRVRRLAAVREMVARQREMHAFDPAEGEGARTRDRVALGAQLLHVAVDADGLLGAGLPEAAVAAALCGRPGEYDPEVLAALAAVIQMPRAA